MPLPGRTSTPAGAAQSSGFRTDRLKFAPSGLSHMSGTARRLEIAIKMLVAEGALRVCPGRRQLFSTASTVVTVTGSDLLCPEKRPPIQRTRRRLFRSPATPQDSQVPCQTARSARLQSRSCRSSGLTKERSRRSLYFRERDAEYAERDLANNDK